MLFTNVTTDVLRNEWTVRYVDRMRGLDDRSVRKLSLSLSGNVLVGQPDNFPTFEEKERSSFSDRRIVLLFPSFLFLPSSFTDSCDSGGRANGQRASVRFSSRNERSVGRTSVGRRSVGRPFIREKEREK